MASSRVTSQARDGALRSDDPCADAACVLRHIDALMVVKDRVPVLQTVQ